MSKITKSDIENIRKAMGTLPSQSPEKSYTIKNDISSIYVKMTDSPRNPYKIIADDLYSTYCEKYS